MVGDCITAALQVNENLTDSWDAPEWNVPVGYVLTVRPVLPYGGLIRASVPEIYEPSPEEILEACLAFQSGWSEDERLRRERGIVHDGRKAGKGVA